MSPSPLAGQLKGLLGVGIGVYTRAVAGIFNSVPIESPPPRKSSLSTPPPRSTHLTLTQCHVYSSQSDHDKGSSNTKDTGDEYYGAYER